MGQHYLFGHGVSPLSGAGKSDPERAAPVFGHLDDLRVEAFPPVPNLRFPRMAGIPPIIRQLPRFPSLICIFGNVWPPPPVSGAPCCA